MHDGKSPPIPHDGRLLAIDRRTLLGGTMGLLASPSVTANAAPAPLPRSDRLADGPYRQLVIGGAMVVPGHGGPPNGPWDIVIRGNRIAEMTPTKAGTAPAGDRVIDATGMFVMPGIIDMHCHVRTAPLPLDYVYYLKLLHGVTTICHHPDRGLAHAREQADLSKTNRILAPRIIPLWPWEQIEGYTREQLETPDQATRIAADIAARGMRIVSLDKWSWNQELFGAICRAVKAVGGITTVHLQPQNNAVMTAVDAARLGATMIEHHYGYAEAALDRTVQDFSRDYNYSNEAMRFRAAGQVWSETSRQRLLGDVVPKLVDHGVTMLPTRVVYEASRDVLRAQSQPWHDKFTHQYLIDNSVPGASHAAFHWDWTSDDEAAWSRAFALWGDMIFEFNKRGGHIVYGTDDPWMWQTPGFANVRELLLSRETGVHALEALKFATHNSAVTLGEERLGLVRPGYIADLAIVDGNPVRNLHTLYAFGAVTIAGDATLDEAGGADGGASRHMRRTRGVVHTIKDGIVIDNAGMMAEVKRMVRESKIGARPNILTEPFL